MLCPQCAAQLADSTRFCPACGAPANAGASAVGDNRTRPANRRGRKGLSMAIALIAGLIMIGAVASLLIYRRVNPTKSAAVLSATATAVKETDSGGASQLESTGFRWSGLTPDQIHAARSALDAAIVREEQIAKQSPAPGAQGQNSSAVLPVRAPDKSLL
jgi:zinc-ribbon domain